MSTTDRIIRLFVVGVIAGLYFTGTVAGLPGYALLVVGVIFLITSLFGSCPLYSLFGISSCKVKMKTE